MRRRRRIKPRQSAADADHAARRHHDVAIRSATPRRSARTRRRWNDHSPPLPCGCTTEISTGLSPVSVNGNGNYNSGNFTPTAVGTYYWTASYSGDANNLSTSTSCGDAGESSRSRHVQLGRRLQRRRNARRSDELLRNGALHAHDRERLGQPGGVGPARCRPHPALAERRTLWGAREVASVVSLRAFIALPLLLACTAAPAAAAGDARVAALQVGWQAEVSIPGRSTVSWGP